jgi:threonine/homoserine/homoserine lactone efflux protein
MLETIISGIGLGIVLSFATGPVFFALLKTSIEKGFHAGISLAGGVLMSDVIYVSLALYGSSFIQFENEYRYVIGLTGAAVMMGIGFFYLFKKVKINYDNNTSTKRNTGYFFKGFLMCIFNPSLLIYWITVTSSIISVTGEIQTQQVFPFFGSILITQFSMDSVKAYYANKLRYKIKERTIVLLNRVAGSLIMIFALKLVYDLLSK